LRVRLDARDVEFVEQLLGPSPHALHIDHAPSPGLAAEEDVLGDGAVGKEVELLEDRGDPGPGGLDRVGEVDLAAVDEQPTRIARSPSWRTATPKNCLRIPVAISTGEADLLTAARPPPSGVRSPISGRPR